MPLLAALVSCGTDLPRGTDHFTIGRTVVRTDSVLDFIGVVYRLTDSAQVPPRGPVRHWFDALATERNAGVFTTARSAGLVPVSFLLRSYHDPGGTDSVCGSVARGRRLCFSGNAPMRARMGAVLDSARAYAPRLASFNLENLSGDDRRRDLADVYIALTNSRSIDSVVAAWTGYDDLRFEVTLARTLATGGTTSNVDPTDPEIFAERIYLTPDAVFQERAYRSPTYIWLALGHQMAHVVVRRMLRDHPALLDHGWQLRNALEPEMARVGYPAAFWDDLLEEQLARAVTTRIVRAGSPTVTWAARSESMLSSGAPLADWLEGAFERYEAARDSFPTLSAFAPRLEGLLDSIPLDSCRAAQNPGAVIIGVDRHRGVLGWLADDSPFRRTNILVGDTIMLIDGDSVSAGGLLLPTRQISHAWARHLPYELGVLDIRRGGRSYAVQAPVNFGVRQQIRLATQAVSNADTVAVCRWNTRAMRR